MAPLLDPPGVGAGGPIPVIDKFLRAQPSEAADILANETHGLLPTQLDISLFAILAVLAEGEDIARGVEVVHPRTVGPRAVPEPQLFAEVVAHEEKLTKNTVIANRPRRKANDEFGR